MKIPKYFTALIIALTFAAAAQANVVNISMDPITGLPTNDVLTALANNGTTTNFSSLTGQVGLYNAYHGLNLAAPTITNFFNGSSNTVNLTGYTYAVIQYTMGPDTLNHGGAIQFVYLNGTIGNYTFSSHGFGSVSSVRLFSVAGSPAPENVRSIMLLGLTSVGLLGTRRLVRA
jgi:hypothetical protein